MLADAAVGAEILETDSVAEYEVIEKTNPYSDYETINENDMLSDFHLNMMRTNDNSNSLTNHVVHGETSKAVTAYSGSSAQPSKPETNGLHTEPPDITKRVFRKTPLPCRRLRRIVLQPHHEDINLQISTNIDRSERQINPPMLITHNCLINKEEEEVFPDLCDNKQIREAGTTADEASRAESPSLYENIDSEDGLSVYDVYTASELNCVNFSSSFL